MVGKSVQQLKHWFPNRYFYLQLFTVLRRDLLSALHDDICIHLHYTNACTLAMAIQTSSFVRCNPKIRKTLCRCEIPTSSRKCWCHVCLSTTSGLSVSGPASMWTETTQASIQVMPGKSAFEPTCGEKQASQRTQRLYTAHILGLLNALISFSSQPPTLAIMSA